MVPAEFVAHDHAYRMLKFRLCREQEIWLEPINIPQHADALGLSRTPVREALFRLMGEGIMELAEAGGYRLFRPNARQLAELYIWSRHLMLAVVSQLRESEVVHAIHGLVERAEAGAHGAALYGSLPVFRALADATGNSEMVRQVQNLGERMIVARLAEASHFNDIESEAKRLTKIADRRAKAGIKRKLSVYFERRLVKSDAISSTIFRL